MNAHSVLSSMSRDDLIKALTEQMSQGTPAFERVSVTNDSKDGQVSSTSQAPLKSLGATANSVRRPKRPVNAFMAFRCKS